ncbi:hypothetical protein N9F40_01435 [bacterium]|nr:hypothetical protein [bacterium]
MFGGGRTTPENDVEALTFLRHLPRDVLFIEPFHGLGNRLRAVACAAALAEKSRRTLVVVWISDHHVNSSMSVLFNLGNLTVVDYHVSHLLTRVWPDVKLYDYNSKGRKDEVLLDTYPGPLYVRSAYVLQSQTRVSEPEISAQLRNFMPSEGVLRWYHALESSLNQKSTVIGVHIRMNTDIRKDVPGIEELRDEDPAGILNMGPVARERRRCHYRYFIPHLDDALLRDPQAVFFISSDSYEAVLAMRARYGRKVISNTLDAFEQCEGKFTRGNICLQIFLAELLILGTRTSELITSDWSSASELAFRLSAKPRLPKSGCAAKRKSWFG